MIKLKELIETIFGVYEPVTYNTYVVTDATQGTYELINVVPDGISGVDWQWIGGFLIFLVFLFCVLRLLGGLFRR